jgi:hypothetical protein
VSFLNPKVGQGTHLSVDERVSQDELLRGYVGLLVGKLVPLGSELIRVEFLLKSLLIGRKLVDESGSNF